MSQLDRLNLFVDRGWLCACSGMQVKVWMYLSRRADGETGDNAFPSLGTIAEAVGNTRRRVSESLRDLMTMGLIELTKPATFTSSAIYRVCTPPVQSDREVPKTDTPAQNEREASNMGSAQFGQETPAQNGQVGGAQNGRPTRSSTRTITRETAAQSSTTTAAHVIAEDQSSPVVLSYPTDRGRAGGATEWHLRQSLVDELAGYFPSTDIIAEARNALAWISADPTRKKTPNGMRKFLTGWLTRAKNRGSAVQNGVRQNPYRNGAAQAIVSTGPRKPLYQDS